MNKFSIIIPVRTINDYLKKNIIEIKNLDYQNFEVIIVVDFDVNYEFNDDRFKIIVSNTKNNSPGEKRNLGASVSTGNILAFLDDDAYPHFDWLSKANKVFEQNPDIYALGSPALTPKESPILQRASGRILESYLASGFTRYRHFPMPQRVIGDYPTVNLFIKKYAFNEINGFDTNVWPGEDTKICLDLKRHFKKEFLYHPDPKVIHHRRSLFIPHLQQISRYALHRGYFAKIYKDTSLRPSYFIPSLFLSGLVFGLILSLIFPIFFYLYFLVLVLYIIILIIESLKVLERDKNIFMPFLFIIGTFLTHVFYGINFIKGLLKEPRLELRPIDEQTGNYLGG